MPAEHVNLGELNQLIGHSNAQKLSTAYGGRRLYVPKRMFQSHKLVELLGFDAAQKMSETYSGIEVSLPLWRNGHDFDRACKAANACTKSDKSAAEIAAEMGVTDRTVYRWRAKYLGGTARAMRLKRRAIQPSGLYLEYCKAAERYRKSGKTIYEIAKEMGVPPGAIRECRKRRDMELQQADGIAEVRNG